MISNINSHANLLFSISSSSSKNDKLINLVYNNILLFNKKEKKPINKE